MENGATKTTINEYEVIQKSWTPFKKDNFECKQESFYLDGEMIATKDEILGGPNISISLDKSANVPLYAPQSPSSHEFHHFPPERPSIQIRNKNLVV